MHTVYGAPLPPSVEASTKGELRIRVDRLVLDDAAINRNPLVQLGGGGNVAAALSPPAAATTTTTAPPSRPVHGEDGADDVMDGDGVGGAASSTTTRHHRLVVPINYCAVSPLFWGEARASAHCQPATPQQSRGPVTLVYPVKVRERVFAEYLHNMTRSAQHGLQLDVYVPSSYSGRRAEPVGRSIVRLDDLVTYKQLSGWFTVAHYRTAPLPAHDESALPPPQQAPRVADAASASPPPFVIIGKMKLHMQLVYFASPARRAVRPVPSKTAADATTTATLTAASTHRRGSSDGGVLATPTQQQQRPPHVTHDATALHTPPPPPPPRASSSSSSTPNPLTRATPTPTTAAAATQPQSPVPHGKTADTVAAAPPAVVVAAATTTTTADGHAAATPHNDDNNATTTSAAPPLPAACTCSNDVSNNNDAGTSASTTTTTSMALHALMRTSARLRDEMAAEEARVHRAVLRPYTTNKDEDDDARDVSDSDDDDDDEGDASLYTSECSDREARLLAMHDVAAPPPQQQQNKQRRQQVRQVRRPPASPQQQQQPLLPLPPTLSEAAPARRGVACVSGDDHTVTRIELSIGNIAFAHNATTSRVRAMRINVRLSSDMTTDSPTAGPYSSYVHRVPLTQRAICLCFPVRRYSAHDSRLVIELYAVLSRADDARTATATTSAQRQRRTHADDDGSGSSSDDAAVREVTAVAEKLLGLCIIGVYAQSREVVLRDCVHDVNHATAHLELQLRPCVQPGEAIAQQQQQQRQQQQLQQQQQRGARRDDTQHARRHRRHRHRRHRTSPHDSDDAHGVRSFHSNDDVDDESDGGSSNRTRAAHASPAHTRRATASHTPPSPRTTQQQQQQQQDGDSARTARRLCVRIAIVSAKELPRVTVYRSLDAVDDTRHHRRRSGHRNSSDDNKGVRADTTASSLSSLRTRVVPLSAAEERCYVSPSSFVVVEDIYSGLDRHHASTAPVSEWHVQHYEHGHYDRTHVVADATCPVYNYLCVASLPRESVYLQQQQQHEQSAGADTTARPCLRELLLTMWHKTDAVTEDAMTTTATADGGDNDDNSSSNGNNEAHNAVAARRRGRTQQQQHEQHKLLQQSDADFWAHTAYMGEVRVDLRPLRYLAQLDGYYRVVATDTAPPGCRAALTAVPGQTIGYVRVCVTLQSPSS